MQLKKTFTLIMMVATCAFFTSAATAQKLLNPFEVVSHKKTSIIHMKNGKVVKGNIKSLDRKKGLIEEIKLKDAKGKKITIAAEDISHMYLPQSGWDKMMKGFEFMNDATMWNNDGVDQNLINDGMAYFEMSTTQIKKKQMPVILQLLNPHFGSKIRMYHDPFAKETMSVGVAGIKVAGGVDKSYYVKKGDGVAFKVEKKNYQENFSTLFGDCKEVVAQYGKDIRWSEIVKAVALYDEVMSKG